MSLFKELNKYLSSADLILKIFSFILSELLPYYHPKGYTTKRFSTGGWGSIPDPCTLSAKYGLIDLLEWERSIPLKEKNDHKTWDEIFKVAAKYGNLNILEYGETHHTFYITETEEICSIAASNGSLSIVKRLFKLDFYDNERIFSNAASNGQYDIVEYLISEGLKMFKEEEDDDEEKYNEEDDDDYQKGFSGLGISDLFPTVYAIIENRRIDVLRWLKETDLLSMFRGGREEVKYLHRETFENDDLSMLKWAIKESGYEDVIIESYTTRDNEQTFLSLAKWSYEKTGVISPPQMDVIAIENGFISVVQWMISIGELSEEDLLELCGEVDISSRNIHALDWVMKKRQTPFLIVSRSIMDDIESVSDIEGVEWIIKNSMEDIRDVRDIFKNLIAKGESVHTMKRFMKLTKLSFDHYEDNYMEYIGEALAHGHLDLAKWLEEERHVNDIKVGRISIDKYYYGRISKGKMTLDTLKWVKSTFPNKGVPRFVLTRASMIGNIPIIIWGLKKGGHLGVPYFVFKNAYDEGRVNVLIWIKGAYPKNYNKYKNMVIDPKFHRVRNIHNFLAMK